MSQGPLCPNLTKKFQKEVSQMANCNFSRVILLGGLSVNLNHLKKKGLLYLQCFNTFAFNYAPYFDGLIFTCTRQVQTIR